MARRKKSRKKKNSPGFVARLFSKIETRHWLSLTRSLGLLLILALLTTGGAKGLQYLEKYVQDVTRQRKVSLKVVLKDPQPRWVNDELAEEICLASGVNCDNFLLDETLTETWAENLRRHPWVKKVHLVRKRYDGMVEIDCELRRPIAKIRRGSQSYFLDAEGIVMPAIPFYRHLVTLKGERSALPRPGEQVRSEPLLAGLGVLVMIRDLDERLSRRDRLWQELQVMDVANFNGRINRLNSYLILYTSNKTPIRWGAPVGEEVVNNEPPAKYKLASLYRTHKKYGSLDEHVYVELRDYRKEKADPRRQPG